MANEKAQNALIQETARAEKALKVVARFVENHGDVDPDDVHYGNVGDMAHVASQLEEIAAFILNQDVSDYRAADDDEPDFPDIVGYLNR